jgi:hypothetical protein
MVVDSKVTHTVGGDVQLDYAPSGLVWCLTCPAAKALEGGRASNTAPSAGRTFAPADNPGVRQSRAPTLH